LLSENLDAARARLNIARPTIYQSIPDAVRNGNGEMMAAA
jgi:hypothetical protein